MDAYCSWKFLCSYFTLERVNINQQTLQETNGAHQRSYTGKTVPTHFSSLPLNESFSPRVCVSSEDERSPQLVDDGVKESPVPPAVGEVVAS